MSNRALILALTIVATVVAPGAAQAMTTTVERTGSGVRIRVTGEGAALSSKNAIGVSEDASANLVVSDTSPDTSAVVPSGSCFQISAKTVGCPPDPSNTTPLEVTSGEGDDVVSINLPQRSASGITTIFVNGGNGADAIFGSDSPDTLEGDGLNGGGFAVQPAVSAPGRDVIFGRGDRDTLRGGERVDYLNGGGGATGADGANTLDGGPGSDYFDVGPALGADRVIGGANDSGQVTLTIAGISEPLVVTGDTVSYERRTYAAAGTAGVTVDLDATADDGATGAAEGDQIDADVEVLIGSPRDDRLVGSSAVNRLEGGPGVDSLAAGGGADTLRFGDGVRDRCYSVSGGVTVSLDLTDPTLTDCQITLIPIGSTIQRLPVDETMPPPSISSALRRAHGSLVTTLRCSRQAPKACSGKLTAEPARGGRRLARRAYRIAPGAARRVSLDVRGLASRAIKTARLTAVGRGVSRRGNTTVVVQRRVR